MGTTTFSTTPAHCTVPADASAAPTSPPISACDEDDGRPSRQVTRFQKMAPSSAASTTSRPRVPCGAAMIPLPTVDATCVPRNAPTRFMTAAIASATRGVRARVATEVAIALAASWKPFVQSKTSATAITTMIVVRSTAQDSLTAMLSTVLATVSNASAASSRVSTTSLSGLLDGVHHVVEGRGEAVDVLPVERRDERRVELHQDLAGEPVARQLGVLDPPRESRPRARLGGHHQRERVGGHLDVLACPGEQREEAVLDGSQPERHGRERYRGWITRRP